MLLTKKPPADERHSQPSHVKEGHEGLVSRAGAGSQVLTIAAKSAMMSGGSCLLDRRRNRLETSSLGMTSSPQDRQMDTAFVDHAD